MANPITVEALANEVDHLRGLVAGLAAILAHVPNLNLADPRMAKSVTAIAHQIAPKNITRSGLTIGTPVQSAEEMIGRVTSISQSLDIVRSAGGEP